MTTFMKRRGRAKSRLDEEFDPRKLTQLAFSNPLWNGRGKDYVFPALGASNRIRLVLQVYASRLVKDTAQRLSHRTKGGRFISSRFERGQCVSKPDVTLEGVRVFEQLRNSCLGRSLRVESDDSNALSWGDQGPFGTSSESAREWRRFRAFLWHKRRRRRYSGIATKRKPPPSGRDELFDRRFEQRVSKTSGSLQFDIHRIVYHSKGVT